MESAMNVSNMPSAQAQASSPKRAIEEAGAIGSPIDGSSSSSGNNAQNRNNVVTESETKRIKVHDSSSGTEDVAMGDASVVGIVGTESQTQTQQVHGGVSSSSSSSSSSAAVGAVQHAAQSDESNSNSEAQSPGELRRAPEATSAGVQTQTVSLVAPHLATAESVVQRALEANPGGRSVGVGVGSSSNNLVPRRNGTNETSNFTDETSNIDTPATNNATGRGEGDRDNS